MSERKEIRQPISNPAVVLAADGISPEANLGYIDKFDLKDYLDIPAGNLATTNSNITGTASNVTGIVSGANGGTGVNNSGKTITLGGNLTTSGNHTLTLTTTGNTSITLPTSGIIPTNNNPTFIGNASFDQASFTGNVSFLNNIAIAGNRNVSGSGSLTFTKDVAFQGKVSGIPIQDPSIPNTMGEAVADNFFVAADGYDHPDVTPSYKTAAIAVKTNRQSIINTAYATFTLPAGEDPDTCKRDIGYVVDAIAADLGNSNDDPLFRSNLYSIQAGKAYYELDGTRRIGENEVAPSKTAFSSVASHIIALIGSSFATYVNSLRDIINGYLDNGLNWAAAPELRYGIQRGRFIDGSNLIRANRDYIIDRVLADLQAAPYNYTLPSGTKCRRDLNFVIDAAIADIRNLSNVNAIATGFRYYEDGQLVIGTDGEPSELTKTITAFRLARDYCMQAIQNKLPNTSNFAEVDGELNLPAISAGGSQFEGSECASVASTAYSIFNIIIGYLENGTSWADAPKRNVGLIEKELPGQSWRTGFASIKRALAEVAKFPGKECTVRVSSGKFYEDNPLIIPQPKTAVIGDNLRTTTICPLNHGQDLFKIDSGTYLNYMVFEDNYRGGFGILDSSNQVNPREMSATATTLRLFPGHTIKDTPGRFKDAANLVRANRLYIDAQVTDYNTLPIIDAVIADLRIVGNINAIAAVAVNNPTKITQTKNLILQAIRNELPNSEANQTSGTDFNSLNPGGVNYDAGDCANVQSAAATLVDIIGAIAAGGTPPEPNTGTLLLVNQEWMQISTLNGNDLVIGSRGVFSTTATRHISGSKCTQNAKAFRYAAAFKDGVNIFLSPYIQNCSNISVLGRTVLKSDGSGELDDTKTLAGGILVDGGVLANTSPIASMVMDAFTQIVSGSVGFHHKRNGYSQLVSVFQVFEDIGILCESGAYTSVTNSATNFGNYALKAVGFSDTPFPFYQGTLVGAENVNLGFNNTPSNIFESTFANAGNSQTRVTLTLEADKISQFVVGQTITVADHSVAAANGTGLIITNVQASDRTISYIVNVAFGSGIAAGGQTGTVTITQGRQVTRLSISGFTSIPLPNYVVKVRIPGTSNFYTRTDGLEYIVEEATPFLNGVTVITLQIVWEGTLPGNTAIELRRPSTINSSSHTFEFIGSGINYTALPENGGVTDPQTQTVEVKSGRVYCSATDQDGNFTVGPFFNVDLKSGKVTFTGTVSLGVIDEIQLKNSPGVPIREFSIDTDLSGDTGAANTRIPTQRAIRDFVKNRLGNLFDKTSGTSGGGSSFAGQLVELTQQGFISETQLPPRSPFNIFNVANQAERLALTNVNQGDYAAQADTGVVYVLKTIANGGASVDDNWAVLPSGVTSASSIAGVIPVTNLGSGTANASTFLAGDSSYKPVVRSLLSGNESIVIGTDAITPSGYPANSRVGDITVTVNTVAYSQGQTSGASSLGVAKFDYTDFDISNGVVSIKDEAVDLNEIVHIPGNSVLGNNGTTTGVVRSLPLNDVVATVPTITVTFSGSTYNINVNGVSLGANPVLTLTKGQTYKFNLNVVGHGFNLTTSSGGISNLYSTGLVGTNGTEVTNDSTKFIWTVPLDAPNILFYQDGVTLSNFGSINLIAGAIAFTEKGANSGVATLDSNGKVPKTQIDLNAADVGSIAFTEKGANDGVATLDSNGKVPKTQIDLNATDVGAIAFTEKGANNGVATLGTDGKIPSTQLPNTLGSGTVTSVGLALPNNIFIVSGSPVTNSGTLTAILANQSAGLIFASPSTGSPAAPTFRQLVGADISDRGQANSVATLDGNGRIPLAQIPRSVSLLTSGLTALTLVATDNGSILEMTASSAIAITLPNNLPVGFNVIVVQKGTGQITFTAQTGGFLRHPDNHTKTAKQYSSATLYVSTNAGGSAAEYILSGSTVV
jgi:hypothetical protein